MRDKVMDLIESCETRLQIAYKDGNTDLIVAYNRIIGDLYDLLRPDDSIARITIDGIVVEVHK